MFAGRILQRRATAYRHSWREISAADLWQLFSRNYLDTVDPVRYLEHYLFEHGSGQSIRLTLEMNGAPHVLAGEGNGPINAAVHALQGTVMDFTVFDYQEHAMGCNADARACAFIVATQSDSHREYYRVGIDTNIVTASVKALVSGINRLAVSTGSWSGFSRSHS